MRTLSFFFLFFWVGGVALWVVVLESFTFVFSYVYVYVHCLDMFMFVFRYV